LLEKEKASNVRAVSGRPTIPKNEKEYPNQRSKKPTSRARATIHDHKIQKEEIKGVKISIIYGKIDMHKRMF